MVGEVELTFRNSFRPLSRKCGALGSIEPRGKNALVAFPLQAFENVRLQTEHRNYLVKGLLANTGLAVIWGPPKCGKSFWAADLGNAHCAWPGLPRP